MDFPRIAPPLCQGSLDLTFRSIAYGMAGWIISTNDVTVSFR